MDTGFFEIKGTLINIGTCSYIEREDIYGSYTMVVYWPGDADIHQTRKEFVFASKAERDRIFLSLLEKLHASEVSEKAAVGQW